MSSYVLVFYSILLFPTVLSECDIGGTWSTWFLNPNQTGYDYCGSCWKANWIRDCLSEPECPCYGPKEFTGEMNTGACSYPRSLCCPGYKYGVWNGVYQCTNLTSNLTTVSPPTHTLLPNETYCPPSGVGIWGSWSEWGNCSAPCGQFGTKNRTRECISETYGCTCCKSDAGLCQTMPCPDTPCPDEPKCSGALVSTYDNYLKYCYPFGKTPPTGSWSEWAAASGSVCNATCGMYGLVNSTRGCFPSGSVCSGSIYSSAQPCPSTPPCDPPRPSCMPPYQLGIVNGSDGCIL